MDGETDNLTDILTNNIYNYIYNKRLMLLLSLGLVCERHWS